MPNITLTLTQTQNDSIAYAASDVTEFLQNYAEHRAIIAGGTQPVPFGSEPQIAIGGNHGGGGAQGYHGSLWFAGGDTLANLTLSAGFASYSATDHVVATGIFYLLL